MTRRRAPTSETRPGQAAFSLPKVSLAVLVLGVAAAFAVPALRRHARSERRDATVSQLKLFANAFQTYAKDRGDWPVGGQVPGAVPPGMERYLSSTGWQEPTPIGGSYQWVTASPQNGGRYAAAIVISSALASDVTADRDLLQEIDRALDDGDLTSGRFFLGYRGLPVYVLEH